MHGKSVKQILTISEKLNNDMANIHFLINIAIDADVAEYVIPILRKYWEMLLNSVYEAEKTALELMILVEFEDKFNISKIAKSIKLLTICKSIASVVKEEPEKHINVMDAYLTSLNEIINQAQETITESIDKFCLLESISNLATQSERLVPAY